MCWFPSETITDILTTILVASLLTNDCQKLDQKLHNDFTANKF